MFDVNTADDTLGTRAVRQILLERSVSIICLPWRNLDTIMDTDLGDLEDPIDILDIPFHRGPVMAFVGRDMRLGQKTGQGSHHSSSDAANDVVKGGRVLYLWFNIIEPLNASMDSVIDRFLESLNEGLADWSVDSGDGNP